MNETSIVLDASNYIKELKHKVEKLNEEIASAESTSSTRQNLWPVKRTAPLLCENMLPIPTPMLN